MQIEPLSIPDVKLILPDRFEDERGFFSETFNVRAFQDTIGERSFVQDNQSMSSKKYTLRGLHYQGPPHSQAKLIRVLHGRILDVAVDARPESSRYGEWVSVELSAERGEQVYVPEGFLHGFLTLEPNTHVFYKTSAYYNKESEGAVNWADEMIGIDWGVNPEDLTISERDREAPPFAKLTPRLQAAQ